MPTSPYGHIETFVGFLMGERPHSILDIGMGNGKLGFIARDCLDVMLNESYAKARWQVRIDGIEVFADYVQDHQRAIYDTIVIGDALEAIETLGSYDMIILGDVLEHFEKERAQELLDKCAAHATGSLVLFVPLGKTWRQPAIYGNEHETHRSFWFFNELSHFSSKRAIFDYTAGPYGAFLAKKEDYVSSRIEGFLAADRAKENGVETLRKRFGLCREAVERIDLRPLARHVADQEHLKYFLDTRFVEHYRLIACLSTNFQNSRLFDIGTNRGYSALALSYNPANTVVSYDIVDCQQLHAADQLKRIEYRIGNVLSDPRLLTSPLIMLDTDHDGVFERQVYEYLRKSRYRGLLFLDDIHLNSAMIRFWNDICEPKEDLTDLGHFSGSGLVEFGRCCSS